MWDDQTWEDDPCSFALASLPWSTSRAGVLRRRGPWRFSVGSEHACLYAVREGEAWLAAPDWPAPVRLATGDIALIPRGEPHCLQHSADRQRREDLDDLTLHAPSGLESGNGQIDTVRLIYGFGATRIGHTHSLHGHLAAMIHLKADDDPSWPSIDSLLLMIEDEVQLRRPGWQAVVKPLVQLTFYQTLRAFMSKAKAMEHCAGDSSSQLVTDPAIGLVVGLLNSQPGDPWTVATLAKSVNMSRSAFSERFRDVVGQPPLQYLTELRMHRAGELLATTDLGVKQIANVVGYESPSSFTNAFKRWHRISPAVFRERSLPKGRA